MGHIQTIYRVNNKEFDTREAAKKYIAEQLNEDLLREECNDLLRLVLNNTADFILPVLKGKTADFLDDKKINLIRENLYDFMCIRRKLLKVDEYEYRGGK